MLNLMCDAGGNAISDNEMGQRVGRPLFLGAPVYFSSQMPTATAASTICAYFGSFGDGVMIGDRLGVTRKTRDASIKTLRFVSVEGVLILSNS